MEPSIIALALCAFVFSLIGMALGALAWIELRAMKNSTHKFVFAPVDPNEPFKPVTPEELKATSVSPYDPIT